MKENFSLNEPLVRRPYLRYKLTADLQITWCLRQLILLSCLKMTSFKKRDHGNSFLIEPPGKVVTVIGIFDKTRLDGVDKFLQYYMILRGGGGTYIVQHNKANLVYLWICLALIDRNKQGGLCLAVCIACMYHVMLTILNSNVL